MGMILQAFAVLVAIVAGAVLTMIIEKRLVSAAEAGPAHRVDPGADIGLPNADRWLYTAGPVVGVIGVALAAVVIPFGPGLMGADLGIGVFYLIVVVDFVVLGLALSGWGTNTRNGVEVFYRITAQLVAYVVPLGLAYIGAIMMARSLSTTAIVEAQSELWYIVLQPIGFILYLVTGLMQCYRAPFLEPFSRHIDSGILPLSGGWKAVAWRITLSGVLFIVAAMGAVLYLGGWQGPLLPGPVWMLLKTYALMVFMVWLGRRFQPLSTDSMLALSWKVLIPVGLLNVLVVGVLILLGAGGRS